MAIAMPSLVLQLQPYHTCVSLTCLPVQVYGRCGHNYAIHWLSIRFPRVKRAVENLRIIRKVRSAKHEQTVPELRVAACRLLYSSRALFAASAATSCCMEADSWSHCTVLDLTDILAVPRRV